MLVNYFRIAWRHLVRDRQFTVLNLAGLSTGLACALLIYSWVSDEMRTDRFHANDKRLYKIMVNQHNANGIRTIQATNVLLARTLQKEMPEVEYAAGVLDNSWYGKVTLSAAGNAPATLNNVKAEGHFADKDFFDIFSYPLVSGDRKTVLAGKNNIVLSKDLALQLFHATDDLIGRTVEWEHERTYTISGIFDGPPANSSDQFDFVTSMDKFIEMCPWQTTWGGASDPATYVVLREGASPDAFDKKIAGFMKTKDAQTNETLFTRPYSSGYLYDHYENGRQAGGRIEYIRLFSIIAIFILIIACINFMNLSTARASKRMKEVGINKVVGARRSNLLLQYLGESVMMSCIALLIALALIISFLPAFNELTGKHIRFSPDGKLTLAICTITILTGLIAGSYPALYLSGFNPAEVLKGRLRTFAGERWLRQGLVVFQFTLSAMFIIGVLVVDRQVSFIQHKNLGYNRDNLVNFDMTGGDPAATTAFMTAVKGLPGVVNASDMDHIDLFDYGTSVPRIAGKPMKDIIQISNIGFNYGMIETLGMTIKTGRSFSASVSADTNEVILNQAAVEAFGIRDPIGKKMTIFGGEPERTIVGVVQNFHYQSLHENVRPFALRLVSDRRARSVMARIRAGSEKQTLEQIGSLYGRHHPGFPFEYKFLDQTFQSQYSAERRVAVLSRYFGGLAILISCLGLFGLSAFTAERRSKEISIRKVLGATAGGVMVLLSKDFLKLVLVSMLVAFPIAWWAAGQWLHGFAYRTETGVAPFGIAAVAVVLITLFTISFQAVRAAVRNPVSSLKSE